MNYIFTEHDLIDDEFDEYDEQGLEQLITDEFGQPIHCVNDYWRSTND